MKWQQGEEMKVFDSKTNQLQLFNTPDEVEVEVDEFNRKVLTENFNRTVCAALAEHIDPSLPGKTLIYCVNDLHADMVVRLLKEAFDEFYGSVHDGAVMKITGASRRCCAITSNTTRKVASAMPFTDLSLTVDLRPSVAPRVPPTALSKPGLPTPSR